MSGDGRTSLPRLLAHTYLAQHVNLIIQGERGLLDSSHDRLVRPGGAVLPRISPDRQALAARTQVGYLNGCPPRTVVIPLLVTSSQAQEGTGWTGRSIDRGDQSLTRARSDLQAQQEQGARQVAPVHQQ